MKKNKKNPMVAIGIPVYNGGKFLREGLQSLIDQTFNDWECVVVDNQSADESYLIAKEFSKKDSRITVIRNKEFVPLVENWNNAFIQANQNAKYYKLLQADDWLYPRFLEECIEIFEKDESIGVVSSYRLAGTQVDGCGLDVNDGNIFSGKDILFKQLTRKLDISGDITTLMFSMNHLKKLNFFPRIFNGKYHIDTELFYDICNVSNVGFVFQVLSYTRRHPESQTSTVVFRYNTLHQLNEEVLYRFKGENRQLNKLYKKERIEYAYFYYMQRMKRNKAYEWHKQNIDRWFTPSEYIKGFIKYNTLSRLMNKIKNKLKNQF